MVEANMTKKRLAYKPFEYPWVLDYVEAIQKAYWVHDEVDFTADVQDFNTALTEKQKGIFKRSILSISQTEVEVKSFWGNIYQSFPKPEFNGLGMSFGECEWRHSEAYSRILSVLDLEPEFKLALENPVFKAYNTQVREGLSGDIFNKLLFFSLVIEDCSLFSKFANVLAFTRFHGLMKNTANMIAWTATDEQIHAKAGIKLINTYLDEVGHDVVDSEALKKQVISYIEQEEKMLDWIFQDGEFVFYTKAELVQYMKFRLDNSLQAIGQERIFSTPTKVSDSFSWFEEEIKAGALDDFFAKRPVDYTKHDKSFTGNDLF